MKILLFCQGLDEFTPKAPELDEKNSLALAIAPSGKIFVCSGSYFFFFLRELHIYNCVYVPPSTYIDFFSSKPMVEAIH